MFQNLSKEGVLLEAFYAVTHPSEPNYIAAVGGDFFGAHDDNFCGFLSDHAIWPQISHSDEDHIPQNISSVVDLLDAKNISWATCEYASSPF